MVNNGVEVYEYDKLVTLDEETVREQMEKHGTIVPYVTDLVLNSLEKSKTIKIVFKHEESIGYEYMNSGDLNIAIDGAIAESGETILEDEPSEEQLASVDENIPIVKLEDLDLKTSTDVYLVDSDYIDYIDMVEEEDLNINTHIKLHPYETLDYFNTDSEIVEQEEQESLEEDDNAESYSCYVCVFGNARMSNDLKYLQDNIKTDRIALSSMAHIFSNSFISPDLSFETTDMLTAIGRNAY